MKKMYMDVFIINNSIMIQAFSRLMICSDDVEQFKDSIRIMKQCLNHLELLKDDQIQKYIDSNYYIDESETEIAIANKLTYFKIVEKKKERKKDGRRR